VVRLFLWKWFPGRWEPRNFAKSTPAMRAIIERHWTAQTTDRPALPHP